jgi:transcriptional regulator with XRE-family HTH domain
MIDNQISWNGHLVRKARSFVGISQKDLCRKLRTQLNMRVSQSLISRVERGVTGGWRAQRCARAATGILLDYGVDVDSAGNMIYVRKAPNER